MSDDVGPGGESGQLGRYSLVRRIGKGGMGEVWLGKVTGAHGFEKPVALKRILPQFSSNPHVVNMLVDEARISVLLSHPNVVQVLELGEVDGEYFIAMEYVEGYALSRLLRKLKKKGKRLDPLEACSIAISVLDGLHAAHIQKDQRGKPAGIIHRDVSPQNVLISLDGQIKVIDFGIARARERLEVTQGASVKGKLRYMSPEQLSPKLIKGAALDHRVDVFAAGIVLYEMLAGRQRFPGDGEVDIMEAILKEDTPDLCREGLIDRDLMHILDKALEKDRDHRFKDAAAFAAQLRGYLYKRDPSFSADRIARRMREAFSEAEVGDPERSEPRREKSRSEVPLHGDGDDDVTRTAFRPRFVQREVEQGTRGTGTANRSTMVRQRSKKKSQAPAIAAGLLLGVAVLVGGAFALRPFFADPPSGDARGTPTKPPPVVSAPAPPAPPPPPAPAPVGSGVEMTVYASPPTTRISLASQPDPKYVSPARLNLVRGEAVELVFEADGYETQRRSLVVDGSVRELRVQLTPLPVDLVISVFPTDAVVTVNGAPARPGMKVVPGVPLEVRAEHPLSEPASTTIIPQPGRRADVRLELKQVDAPRRGVAMPKGTLVIKSTPSGADVYIDGRKVPGGITPFSQSVLAGEHRVTVKFGNAEQTWVVDVANGETETREARFE